MPACPMTVRPWPSAMWQIRTVAVIPPTQAASGWRMSTRPWLAASANGWMVYQCSPLANLHVALGILGQRVVFKPFDTVRSQGIHETDDVLDVERHPRVNHQLDIRADLLADPRDQLLALANARDAVLRPPGQEDLDRLEPQLQEPC